MSITFHLAKHFREMYFGGNWTASNLKDKVSDLSWEQAVHQTGSLNTIAALTFHIHYYVSGVLKVLRGGDLDISDKFSYAHPPITSQEEWDQFLQQVWLEGGAFADAIEQLEDEVLLQNFLDGKYGNMYRNLSGIIEHGHYHLGQIALIRKIILEDKAPNN